MNMTLESTLSCPYHEKKSTCVDHIRLFEALPDEARTSLLKEMRHTSHRKGEILVQEGESIDAILVVRTGIIKTYRIDASGEEHVMDVLHAGQAIWHGMFLEDHIYHYSVACMSDVNLCILQREKFENVLGRYPKAAMNLIQMLSTDLDEAEEKNLLLGMRSPVKRLASFLLWRDRRMSGQEITMKLEDIGSFIGLRPETISRALTSLAEAGCIQRTGRARLQVLDRDKLKQISQ